MPVYSYFCDFCETNFDTFKVKYNPSPKRKCPVCRKMAKLIVANMANVGEDHPRWSWAMGVNVSQIEEAKKVYPNAIYNKKGQLYSKNWKHHQEQAKERGMVID